MKFSTKDSPIRDSVDLNSDTGNLEFDLSAVPLHSARHPGLCAAAKPDSSLGRPGVSSYGIIFITQGEGECVVDAQAYRLGAGSVLFLRPNQRVVIDSIDAYCGFEILFSEAFLTLNEVNAYRLPGALLFDGSSPQQCYDLASADAERALKIIQDIKNEYELRHPAYVTALRSFLIVLLLHFWRALGSQSTQGLEEARSGQSTLVTRYIRLVADEPRLERTVAGYAKELGVSASHLHELVKDATGLTPIAIIQREVILEAKRQLIHTTRQVADIAQSLSFKDASYFGRYFRRNTKMTPGKFRQVSRRSLGLEPA